MPQQIGEIYKSLVPSLSDDASIEEAFQMYHYGTATYNGNNLQPQSMERHIIDLNENISRIDGSISSLENVYIEQVSSSIRPNLIVSQDSITVPLTIRGSFSQSSVLQRWQKNTGSVATVAQITSIGSAGFDGYISIGSTTPPLETGLSVTLTGNHKGVTVKGAFAQTEDLQQWQNSSGSALSRIDYLGNITTQNIETTNANIVGTATIASATVSGTTNLSGNLTSTADISARMITLTNTGSSIVAAGEVSITGALGVTGITSTRNLSVDGTITAFGKITSTGDIEASGDLKGSNIQLTQSLVTAANITANGIIKARSPNQGTTGGVRVIADSLGNSFLQFVNSADSAELANIRADSSGLTLSRPTVISGNTSVTGNLSVSGTGSTTTVISPVGNNSSGVRQIFISTDLPLTSQGTNGDIWVQYV